MFLMISKKSRKNDRSRSKRFRAKLKAKYKARKARLYQADRKLAVLLALRLLIRGDSDGQLCPDRIA